MVRTCVAATANEVPASAAGSAAHWRGQAAGAIVRGGDQGRGRGRGRGRGAAAPAKGRAPAARQQSAESPEPQVVLMKVKYEHQRPNGTLQRMAIPKWNWERIAMDFVVGLPNTLGHNVYISVLEAFAFGIGY
ncbi:uncharacterized protein LOC132038109 [Lycium ferocissimum]|uniref:uncharacterized protein LOC132038109 n=1 Tax=Lycium ferocissimum TaxID=112874 RepID=UPI0028158A42|nr:uncharacterized protein LOC132038109 [Lycium ferocissimum]